MSLSGHEAQATIFSQSSPSDSNIQPGIRTTALTLGGPGELEELVASALPRLRWTCRPTESELSFSKILREFTCTLKSGKHCFGILMVLCLHIGVNPEAISCAAPTPEILIWRILDGPWALVGFKSFPGNSPTPRGEKHCLTQRQIEVSHLTLFGIRPTPPPHVDVKAFLGQQVTPTELQ